MSSEPLGRAGDNVESRVDVPDEGLQGLGRSAVGVEEPVAGADLVRYVGQQNMGPADPRFRKVTLGVRRMRCRSS